MNIGLIIIVNIIVLALAFYFGFYNQKAFSEIYYSIKDMKEPNWKFVSLCLGLAIICALFYIAIIYL